MGGIQNTNRASILFYKMCSNSTRDVFVVVWKAATQQPPDRARGLTGDFAGGANFLHPTVGATAPYLLLCRASDLSLVYFSRSSDLFLAQSHPSEWGRSSILKPGPNKLKRFGTGSCTVAMISRLQLVCQCFHVQCQTIYLC
jgi:hypothetical protein